MALLTSDYIVKPSGAMGRYDGNDMEKNPAVIGDGNVTWEKRPSYVDSDRAVPGKTFAYGDSFIAPKHIASRAR